MGAQGPPRPPAPIGRPARRRWTPVGLLSASLVLAAGCELTSVELAAPESVVIAEVVLEAGAPTQRAFLYTSLAAAEPLPAADIRVRAVDGGAAELRYEPAADSLCIGVDEPGGGEPVAGEPDAGTTAPGTTDPRIAGACYTTPPGPAIEPGTRYELEVRLEDGRRITGRTTVPGDFAIVQPAASPCVLGEPSLELTWTRSAGTGAYQIEGLFTGLREGLAERGVVDPPDSLRLVGLAIGVADTTLTFPAELGIFDRFDIGDVLLALREGLPEGAAAEIAVAAGDPNFVNWARGGNFNPSGQVRVSSVSGDGMGVFGGLVIRRVRVVGAGEGPACR